MIDGKTKKMQDRVAKLLRQAEDVTGTPEEAVFQAKAFELISKYGLEMAHVTAAKEGLDVSELPDAVQWSVKIDGKYVSQQALLLHGIAQALHCKTVYRSSRHEGYTLFVFGVERHIDRVQFLWSILRPQMLRLVESARPDGGFEKRLTFDWRQGTYREKSTAGQLRSYRRAWIAGFAQAVSERVRQEESKALEGDSSGALVLYRDDQQRAAQALNEAFPLARTERARTRYDHRGYSHGHRDGSSASMQRSLAS